MTVDDIYTKSLLHFNGADASVVFTDESGKTWTPGGDAQIDTGVASPLTNGAAVGQFDGTDWIETADHADFDVGSGDFTIDFWFRPDSINQNGYLCAQCNAAGADTSISWFMRLTTLETIEGGIVTGGTYKTAVSAVNQYAANTWLHMALIRNGNNIYIASGGVIGTGVDVTGVTANNSANKPTIGRLGEYAGLSVVGRFEEFRFSKGIARWTENFTPPTREYSGSVKRAFQNASIFGV